MKPPPPFPTHTHRHTFSAEVLFVWIDCDSCWCLVRLAEVGKSLRVSRYLCILPELSFVANNLYFLYDRVRASGLRVLCASPQQLQQQQGFNSRCLMSRSPYSPSDLIGWCALEQGEHTTDKYTVYFIGYMRSTDHSTKCGRALRPCPWHGFGTWVVEALVLSLWNL